MQVKDYIQTLLDESQIRVEKIGSGNWYWSFVTDAKKDKEKMLQGCKEEETKLKSAIEVAERDIEEEEEKRLDDDEMLVDGEGIQGMDRKELLRVKEMLKGKKENMETELMGYRQNDPAEVLRKKKEIEKLKEGAERWTDNIEALMGYLKKSAGMDKSQIAGVMEQVCGDEWISGDGLKEL